MSREAKNKKNTYNIHPELLEFMSYSEDEFIVNTRLKIKYLKLIDLQNESYWKGIFTKEIKEELLKPSIHFKEHGVYFDTAWESYDNIEFFEREAMYCIYGRFIKGIYFPGYLYFYLNYSTIPVSDLENTKMSSITFPRLWITDLQFFHYAELAELLDLDGGVLKKRRGGYSMKFGSMLARNFYFYPGSSQLVLATVEKNLSDMRTNVEHHFTHNDVHCSWKSIRENKNNRKMVENSWYEKNEEDGTLVLQGTKSSISFINASDPGNVRGSKARLILFEEFGNFPGGKKAWTVSDPIVRENGLNVGSKFFIGTGGSIDNDSFEAINAMFLNPKAYKILPVKNIYTEGKSVQDIAYFVPSYYGYDKYVDELGFTDIERAKQDLIDEIEVEGLSEEEIRGRWAEKPFDPYQALGAKSTTIFDSNLIADALLKLDIDEALLVTKGSKIGYMTKDANDSIIFVEDYRYKPIVVFPTREDAPKKGAVVIHKHPERLSNGTIQRGRYIIGIDTYSQDMAKKGSLYAALVYDRYTNEIVAEYFGRVDNYDIENEIALNLTIYYNAYAIPERNVNNTIRHFQRRGAVQYLVKQSDLTKRDGSGDYGISMQIYNIREADKEIATYLKSSYNIVNTTTGTLEGSPIQGAYKIKCLKLLAEMSVYDGDMNVDGISAFRLIMLYVSAVPLFVHPDYIKTSKSQRETDSFFNKLHNKLYNQK